MEPVAAALAITRASLEQALARVRDGGLVVLTGRPPAPIAFDMTTTVLRELRCHAVGWAPLAEALLGSPDLPVDDLLGPVPPLAALGELLAQADERTRSFVTPLPRGRLPGTGSCVAWPQVSAPGPGTKPPP